MIVLILACWKGGCKTISFVGSNFLVFLVVETISCPVLFVLVKILSSINTIFILIKVYQINGFTNFENVFDVIILKASIPLLLLHEIFTYFSLETVNDQNVSIRIQLFQQTSNNGNNGTVSY